MDPFASISETVAGALSRVLDREIAPPDVTVEPPRDPDHGDMATNAALVFAKQAGMKPRDLAEKLATELGDLPGESPFEALEIAGPGFLNMRLSAVFWLDQLNAVAREGADYGRAEIGASTAVNVEFVSANPTGPMHVGHCRGAVFGDALANLLAFAGYAVTREYYINDAGAQIDTLARSAFLRYREALGEADITIPEGLYPGDYLKPVGAALAKSHGDHLREMDEAEWLSIARDVAIDMMMDQIREDLAALSIRHDVFFSERSLIRDGDKVGATIADLRGRGLIYEGRLEPPKGKPPEDWEDREQTLFRATEFGDDVDRALMKSDGSYTYFATDIAYHRDKLERGFQTMINVWGADHGGYVKRMQAAVAALSDRQAELDIKLIQLVKLYRGGEPVRMSKRSGDFVTLRDVVDEVGQDVVRFIMLYRKNDAPLDFDFVKVMDQSKDNPVFYVQYAHARCRSVMRNLADTFGPEILDGLPQASADLYETDGDQALIKAVTQFPRVIRQAAVAHEPHRVAFYLYELASQFHALWTQGKDTPQLRFIHPEAEQLSRRRLVLVRATATVLANGLALLGVKPAEEMR